MKKIIIFLLMTVCFAGLVSSTLDSPVGYWSLDSDTFMTGNLLNWSGMWNFTNTGTGSNVEGIINDGFVFNGGTDRASTAYSIFSSNVSLCFWANISQGSGDFFSIHKNSDANNFALWRITAANNFDFRLSGTWGNVGPGGMSLNFNQDVWEYHCVTHNTTDTLYYINGSLESVNSGAWGSGADGTSNRMTMAAFDNNGVLENFVPAAFDEVNLYYDLLTQDQILTLYNEGQGFNPISPITFVYPQEGEIFNDFTGEINFTTGFNSSCGVADEFASDWLWGSGDGTNWSFVNQSTPDGSYNITFVCNNTETLDSYNNSVSFIVDTVDPMIYWQDPFLNNQSVFFDMLFTQINFTDDNLFSYNVSVDGTTYKSNTSLSTSFDQVNVSLNVSTFTPGFHNISAYVCDGHTAKYIPKYKHKTDNKELFYEWGSSWLKISPKNKGLFSKVKTNKHFDRYDFGFTFYDSPPEVTTFVVESNHDIEVVDSDYDGHLVIPAVSKWVDFETFGSEAVVVNRVNKKKVEVFVIGLSSKDVVFNSVGDLNCQFEFFNWLKVNATSFLTSPVVENSEFYNEVNLTYNSSYFVSSNASLYYNGSVYSLTQGALSDTLISYFSLLTSPNVSGDASNNTYFYEVCANNVCYNTTPTLQAVLGVSAGNCSLPLSAKAINFTIFNESSELKIPGTIDFWSQLTIGETVIVQNTSYTGENSYLYCYSPGFQNASLTGQLVYDRSGFEPKTYYFNNYNLDNVTDYINLYLTNGSSQVELQVVDSVDDPVADVFIYIQSYDLGTNSWITSEVVKTNSFGSAFAQVVYNTKDYQFQLVKDGVVLLQSSSTKILSTPLKFVVQLLSDPVADYESAKNISSDLVFDNSTLTFTLDYSNTQGLASEVCLKLRKTSVVGDTNLGSNCSSNPTGPLTINITVPTGQDTFLAQATAIINGKEHLLAAKSVTFDNTYKLYGEQGLFLTFFVVLSLGLVGLWHPAAMVLLAMFGFFFGWATGFFHLSTGIFVLLVILSGIVMYRLKK